MQDKIHLISTMLTVTYQAHEINGTGFLYQKLGEAKEREDGKWRTIEEMWLVTNRHIILPEINETEVFPDVVIFYQRKQIENKILWDEFILDKYQLQERLLVHQNSEIDIALIRVYDLLKERVTKTENSENTRFIFPLAVSQKDFPENRHFEVEVGDDILVIGYPQSFYDETNKFPIVKSGIIASRWGAFFNGSPYFLIDAKLFPGSSGSLVITKPTHLTIKDGVAEMLKEKAFALLGIYSADPTLEFTPIDFENFKIIQKEKYDVGIVWYGQLIEDIIENGIQGTNINQRQHVC